MASLGFEELVFRRKSSGFGVCAVYNGCFYGSTRGLVGRGFTQRAVAAVPSGF